MQTIGERLEDARKRKGVSVREAAEATKIRGDYLQKFENNQFDIGLADIYVRGFLGNYATFLKLPADRVLADFAGLGQGQSQGKSRPPAREGYGRMDLSVSGAEERPERTPAPEATALASAEPARPPVGPARGPRTGGMPATPALINQKTMFMGLIALVGLIAVLVIVWIGMALFGGRSSHAADRPAAVAVAEPAAAPTLSLVASRPVQLTVLRQSDNAELYQGELETGERREFPNTALLVTASAIDALQIEYKGARYLIGGTDFHGARANLKLNPMP